MSAPTDTELRAAYLDWFDFRGIPSIALTLTFKPKLGRKELDTEVAEEALRHFLRRLNRMRGNSRKRPKKTPLQTMAIREGYFGGGYPQFHYHLQIEVPGDSDPQEFADRCLQLWKSLRWGSEEQAVAMTNADSGWTSYCLKFRTKQDFGKSVDVLNSFILRHEGTPTASRVPSQ